MMRVWCSLVLIAVSAVGLSQANETVKLLESSDWAEAQKTLAANKAAHLPHLIDLLATGTTPVKTRAAVVLRLIDDESAVPALAKAFSDLDSGVRKEAIWSLAFLLRDKDFGIHGVSYDKVSRIKPIIDLGKPVVPYLVEVLDKPHKQVDERVRFAVTKALDEIGDRGALEGLLREMKRRRTPPFGLYLCMQAIVKFDDPRIIPAIIDRIHDEMPDYGDTPGTKMLAKLGEKVYPSLVEAARNHPKDWIRMHCLLALHNIFNARALSTILEATQDPGMFTRITAFKILHDLPTPVAEPAVIRGLGDKESRVREEAQSVGDQNGFKITFDDILTRVKDADGQRAGEALLALVQINGERTKTHLLSWLTDPRLSRYAIDAVRTLEMKEAEDLLIRLLASNEPFVASEAAQLLGSWKSAKAIPHLIEMVKEKVGRQECRQAADALAEIGKPALQPLLEALQTFPRQKRIYIIQALRGANDKAAVDALLPYIRDEYLALDSIESLGLLGDQRAIPSLMERLKSGSDAVRAGAAEALGRLKARQAVGLLIQTMSDDKASYVEAVAAQALGRIGDPQALEPLLGKMDTRMADRWMVVEALGSFREDRVLDLLIKELESGWEDAAAAARALAKMDDQRALPALLEAYDEVDDRAFDDVWEAIQAIRGDHKPTSTTSNPPQSA